MKIPTSALLRDGVKLLEAAGRVALGVEEVTGFRMARMPGGLFVQGTKAFEDAAPRWVGLSPFLIGETVVTEGGWRTVVGATDAVEVGRLAAMTRAKFTRPPDTHPATFVSWDDVTVFLEKLNAKAGLGAARFRRPTEAEWEFAARGPAVNLREALEKDGIKVGDVAQFVDGRYENFFTEFGGRIFVDAKGDTFQRLLASSRPIYGWNVYGTPSGRLTQAEAWFNQSGLAAAEWGSANGYRVRGATGGVWEWVDDIYHGAAYDITDAVNPVMREGNSYRGFRGGSWYSFGPDYLRAACRDGRHPGLRDGDVGFRLAAALQDSLT